MADNRTIDRRAVRGEGDLNSFVVDNQFKVLFNSGSLRHTLLMGLDYMDTEWTHDRYLVWPMTAALEARWPPLMCITRFTVVRGLRGCPDSTDSA